MIYQFHDFFGGIWQFGLTECVVGEGRVCSNILLWKVIFFVCFVLTIFFFFMCLGGIISENYENVSVSLIKRRTAVPIDGLVGIEVAWEILNK